MKSLDRLKDKLGFKDRTLELAPKGRKKVQITFARKIIPLAILFVVTVPMPVPFIHTIMLVVLTAILCVGHLILKLVGRNGFYENTSDAIKITLDADAFKKKDGVKTQQQKEPK